MLPPLFTCNLVDITLKTQYIPNQQHMNEYKKYSIDNIGEL